MAKEKKTLAKKKTVAKKTAPKKMGTKSKKKAIPKKEIRYAAGPEAFWVTNGMILHDIIDLAEALSEMADDHFLYHAQGEQNDFSVWVKQILCDEECANALLSAKTKKNAAVTVKKHLKVYSL